MKQSGVKYYYAKIAWLPYLNRGEKKKILDLKLSFKINTSHNLFFLFFLNYYLICTFQDVSDVVISKMDATANEVHGVKVYKICIQISRQGNTKHQCSNYRPSLKKGSDQLFVTLYKLYIYPSIDKQLIRTLFQILFTFIHYYIQF